ncbi:response regulator transcription factor [Desulfosporosinus metallidurans]|uniref:Stage 0 sporulation protein A homolog n=1 Tax=Desulfosporosinus metallidurans TaxID=1888891 RepID=A0A1Q8QXE3_9FIRM|nr:response regulator [Desulfosporosinus metallidurans]OLN32003.1 DNA-binding response regulator, AraC family [Desulfosporosinus metallidurans]
MFKVLIVDDDKVVRYMLKRYKKWANYGFSVEEEASDGKEALRKLSVGQIDLVITDIKMPGMDGIEFLSELRFRKWDVCSILLSTHSDFEYAKQGIRLGAFDFITKPLEDDVLSEALERAKKYLDEKNQQRIRGEEERRLIEDSLTHFYPKKREERIADLILAGNLAALAEAETAFSELAKLLDQDLFKTAKLLEIMLLNLSGAMYKEFSWLQKVEEAAFRNVLLHINSMCGMKSEFLSRIRGLIRVIRKYELHRSESIVRKTCQYITDHIDRDINLELVANEIYVSKDYLGKIFKQKTGVNFNDYLTKIKMEYAKHLLGTGEFKNYEISEKLGYSSPDYFCRLFKNYTGYTPLQFRKLGA